LALNSDTFNSSGLDLKISAGMENILNKNYRNHLSTARGSITAEPGRNIYLKLTLNF
jgi:outer membrane receptor protein involved in Fe transport